MSADKLDQTDSSRLAELVAFNREVSALVRLGLPLETGLGTGEADSLSARIGEHLRSGRTLPEALARESHVVPPTYRALIEAGLEAGNLPVALETISRSARTMAALRRKIAFAMIYPAVIILAAVLLTIFVLSELNRLIYQQFVDMHEAPPRFVAFLMWLVVDNPLGWLYWLPALVLLFLWGIGGTRYLALRLPGIGFALRYYRLAVFADLASSLLDNSVSLEQALPLAGGASGDKRLARETDAAAARLRGGEPPTEAMKSLRSLPAFAWWMIGTGAAQGSLPATLEHLARWARRRGDRSSAWFTTIAPVALTLVLGGSTLIVYATISFAPVISLLKHLGQVPSI